jgi:DNA-binding Xre family transcriptional regulator
MSKKPVIRNHASSPDQVERDRQIRAKYQNRPSLQDLIASGDYETPIKQGDYLAVMGFAARIKARREQLQLSLTDLASRSGIDKAALSRLENGLVGNPTIGTLERIARSLKSRLKIELEDEAPINARRK